MYPEGMDETTGEDTASDRSGDTGTSADGDDPLGLIGETLKSTYRIERYIGRGGFGHVYAATNQALFGREVVIKFLRRPEAIDGFRTEASIQANLNHHNICPVEAFLPEQRAIVIPFIDGQDCAQLIRDSGPLPPARVLRIGRALLGALVYAHDQGVAHRDLKPSNIMIDSNRHVRLIDFGIARATGETNEPSGKRSGTASYLPPEQANNESDDPVQRDIYALGCTLFELATGVRFSKARAQFDDDDWGGESAGQLSDSFKAFLRKATHVDANGRFQSMAEMAEAFESLNPSRSEGWWLGKVAVVAGLIVVSVVAGYSLFPEFRTLLDSGDAERAALEKPALTNPVIPSDSDSALTMPSSQEDAGLVPVQADPGGRPRPDAAVPPPDRSPGYTLSVRPIDSRLLFEGAVVTEEELEVEGMRIGDIDTLTVYHPMYPVTTLRLAHTGERYDSTFDMTSRYSSSGIGNLRVEAYGRENRKHNPRIVLNEFRTEFLCESHAPRLPEGQYLVGLDLGDRFRVDSVLADHVRQAGLPVRIEVRAGRSHSVIFYLSPN